METIYPCATLYGNVLNLMCNIIGIPNNEKHAELDYVCYILAYYSATSKLKVP